MYLLQVNSKGEFSLVEEYGEQIPRYAILSHTWIATHEEVTFKDIMKCRGKEKRGYEKLHFCAKQATKDKLQYFWIDTCCIDKSSSAELQEAINSMFKWYQNSAKCYVYLEDVSLHTPSAGPTGYGWKSAFRRSRWFTRGWTLQELLAPTSVEFFTREGTPLGDKHSLWQDINEATGIPSQTLHGNVFSLFQVPINDRLKWARNRHTTREEDKCYSLLGLFNVHMSLLYGEGRKKAFRRFHEELKKEREDQTELNAILAQVQARQHVDELSVEIMPDRKTRSVPPKRSAIEAFGTEASNEARSFSAQPRLYESSLQTTEAQGSAEHTHHSDSSPKAIDAADLSIPVVSEVSFQSTLSREHLHGAEDDAEQEQAHEMQLWWDEAVARTMYLPEGYSQVSVLLVKWEDELDELKTRTEVDELEAVFRERFNFHTKILELNVRTKPQLQLNGGISNFAADHDGPNSLLIVYYTGHAVWRDLENYLQLSACLNPSKTKGLYRDGHASWNKAEDILKADEIDADTLVILDACYSSNITKGYSTTTRAFLRKFELLSAAPIDQTTAAPGSNSFTRTLIDNLEALLQENGDKPFSTFHLNQRICMDKRRLDTPSQLWVRLPNENHVLLAPMRDQRQNNSKWHTLSRSRGRLTLSFDLRDGALNKEQVEYLVARFTKAFKNKKLIGLRRINWHGIKSLASSTTAFIRVALVACAIVQWKKVVRRKREEREAGRYQQVYELQED